MALVGGKIQIRTIYHLRLFEVLFILLQLNYAKNNLTFM